MALQHASKHKCVCAQVLAVRNTREKERPVVSYIIVSTPTWQNESDTRLQSTMTNKKYPNVCQSLSFSSAM